MRINPLTKEVYTNQGEFIKKMDCPFEMDWDNLTIGNKPQSRNCAQCNQSIIDTAYLSDEELLNTLKENPHTCLKIDLQQANIQLSTNGRIQQR